jgi:hypothetical protein
MGMRKYTDSQILRTIRKQCRKDIEYQDEQIRKYSKEKIKIEFTDKLEAFRNALKKQDMEHLLDTERMNKRFDQLSNDIIKHSIARQHSERILDEINDMRKEQKKETKPFGI